MAGDMPLTAIAQPDDQEAVFRRHQRFQLPMEPLHLAHRQTTAKNAILQTPAVPVQRFVDGTPTLWLGNVVTDDIPMLGFVKLLTVVLSL
jgi:hypothetical protein